MFPQQSEVRRQGCVGTIRQHVQGTGKNVMTTAMQDDTKRCDVPDSPTLTTSCAHRCPTDGRPCEVVALITPGLLRLLPSEGPAEAFGEVMATSAPCLPCHRCRRMEAEAGSLPRLGKHERRALLLAVEPEARTAVIPSPTSGRSADE